MGSEMVERVAKAICKSRTCEGFSCCEWPAQMGRKHDCPVTRGGYDDAARAAIEAMREPTLEMRKACSFEEAEVTWPTLIDAALSPLPEFDGTEGDIFHHPIPEQEGEGS